MRWNLIYSLPLKIWKPAMKTENENASFQPKIAVVESLLTIFKIF